MADVEAKKKSFHDGMNALADVLFGKPPAEPPNDSLLFAVYWSREDDAYECYIGGRPIRSLFPDIIRKAVDDALKVGTDSSP
jgi:hypothetical protein